MDEENKPLEGEETGQTTPSDNINKEEEYLNNWKRERADFLNYKKTKLGESKNLLGLLTKTWFWR